MPVISYDRVVETSAEQALGKFLRGEAKKRCWDTDSKEFRSIELNDEDDKLRDLILWYVDWYWKSKYTGIPPLCEVGGPMPEGSPYRYPNREKAPLTMLTSYEKISAISQQKADDFLAESGSFLLRLILAGKAFFKILLN